ncbi:hypothetical protein CONPUDRAFT_84779 [Coniophora puteana RWD-64-598 SS2]|uniref:Uncharacterized protein n=1 Tax=Coniophora puteana (strain RWD-64-598) TaxID=741705 RepID=A0A5M3MD75_CONPW|nr:uncharacterized protein CONPUDRAFT_84779 [Coniophora puteana RWD-64-598 SS2]EIW76967.1 hypothetical protein CONPUDRAFT_84779 [Coniophora puteana RWD-64-598 SS2]
MHHRSRISCRSGLSSSLKFTWCGSELQSSSGGAVAIHGDSGEPGSGGGSLPWSWGTQATGEGTDA